MTNDERAQIRADAVRECICKPPAIHTACPVHMHLWNRSSLTSLLRPDPAEASEPLQSAPCRQAPVDHGPRAAAHGEAGTLHEPTVRECIDALRRGFGLDGFSAARACAIVATLLPKPDPATDLINDWLSTVGIEPERDAAAMMLTFARWAVDTGRLKG